MQPPRREGTTQTEASPPPGHSFPAAGSSCVLPCDPVLIVAAGRPHHPGTIVEIPSYVLPEARFEGFARLPAEFPPELRRIDRIAAVVAGTVLHGGERLW